MKKGFSAQIGKLVDESDIIIEVLDARFPEKTRNKEIENKIEKQGKKIIYVLNKSDLVKNLKKTELKELKNYVTVSCKNRKGIKELRDKIKLHSKKIEKDDRIVVGVIGYPNTGKSSLINLLIGKASAKTGAEAGFTKGLQKLKLTAGIVLLDSPGVIPKKEYSSAEGEAIARHTKVGGRSHSQVKHPDMIVARLIKEFPNTFEKFYKIKANGNSEFLIEKLGRKKGFLKKGNKVNEDKTARLIIKDWQDGKIEI